MKNLIIAGGFMVMVTLFGCKGSSGTATSNTETSNTSNKNVETIKNPQTVQPQSPDEQVKPAPTIIPTNQLKNTMIKKDIPSSK